MMTNRCEEDADRGRGDGGLLEALMLGYCRGERDAFEQLYSRVAPAIFGDLIAWSGDRQRAEALLDRTFRVLHERRSSYIEGADPRPWISQIARSELVADRRRRASEARRPLWSRVRTAFARDTRVELEARS